MVLIKHQASSIKHQASSITLIDHFLFYNGFLFYISSYFNYFLLHAIATKNYRTVCRIKVIDILVILILLATFLLPINSANALSAVTSQKIIGNAPRFDDVQNATNKLGFKVNDILYREFDNNIKSTEIKVFDGEFTFDNFQVQNYDTSNLVVLNNYKDSDGDGAHLNTPFIITDTEYKWFDNSGKQIDSSEYQHSIGCGSGYYMPLRLVIATQVKVKSQYGIPDESEYITLKKEYKIATKPAICFAKPNATITVENAQWHSFDDNGNSQPWNLNNAQISSIYGGGRTTDYVLNFGFKASPTQSNGKKFPTTGFPGAKFQLVMAGSQYDYRFSLITPTSDVVTVSADGFVTLNKKPVGNVTIRATLKREPAITFDYTFNPTSVWAVPTGDYSAIWAVAVQDKCGSESNVLSRQELTNSPQNQAPQFWTYFDNNYTRKIGGGLSAEWGQMNQTSYPDSNWRNEHYWTRDYYSPDRHFVVHSVNGGVGYDGYENKIGKINYIACKQ